MTSREQILAREARFALPAAIAAMAAVLLIFVVPTIGINQIVSGDNDADFLRDIDSEPGLFLASMIARGIGYIVIVAPLLYLFKAVTARSEAVKTQLVGVVYASPVFLAISTVLVAFASVDAASEFVGAGVPGSGPEANDAARELINESDLRAISGGFGLAGQLGFAVAMAYTAYHAMKVGLLTRFWGSLGAALGVASFLFPLFALLWFIYLGLLIAGWVPGGRPPAWETGEAVPWPKPGEELLDDEEDGEEADGEEDHRFPEDWEEPRESREMEYRDPGEPKVGLEDEELPPAPAPSRSTQKRKRKRRD